MTKRLAPQRSRGASGGVSIEAALADELDELVNLDPSLGTPLDAARYAVRLAIRHLTPRTIGFSVDKRTLEGLADIKRSVEGLRDRSEAARWAAYKAWEAIDRGEAMPPAPAPGPGRMTAQGLAIDGPTLRRLDVIAGSVEGLGDKRSPALCYAVWFARRRE